MAKEFKDYERKYKHLAGTALKFIAEHGGKVAREDIAAITKWDEVYSKYETYGPREVAYAVYKSPTADSWQQFRVRLKGLSTREKLYALMWYQIWIESTADVQELLLVVVRVNNYLGALIRGGQLNANLEVVR